MEVAGKRLETDNETELCEPCATENLSKPADGFCEDCNEFMCQKCFRHHLKGKLCRNHVLDPLNGASSQGTKRIQEEKCKKHAKEIIKYFCSTHKYVGCGDCIVSKHQKCDTEFIKDLAKKYEESYEFKTLLRQIQKWETDIAEDETHIQTNHEENKTLFDNAFRDIRNFRREINEWLDKMENNLEEEIRNLSDDNETQMAQLEEKIKNMSSEIESIKEQLDSNAYHADNLFIRHVEYMTRIGQVDKTLSDIKPNNVIKSFTFEPETKVKDMLTSSVKLGIIRVKSDMIPGRKQQANDESSAQTALKIKTAIKTENKQSIDTDSSARKNAYIYPAYTGCAIKTENKQPTDTDSLARKNVNIIPAYTGCAITTENKQPTDTDSLARENVYITPDPRAEGFDVGKRVKMATQWESRLEGTVVSAEPTGYVSVKWDNGKTFSHYTYQLKLL